MIRRKGIVYKLDTLTTTLLLRADADAGILYYGPRLNASVAEYETLIKAGNDAAWISSFAGTEKAECVSSFGGPDNKRSMVSCAFADGSFTTRFVFQRARLTDKPSLDPLPSSYCGAEDGEDGGESRTLCLEFADEPSRLRLYVYYTVFSDSDVISVSTRLCNGGRKDVLVKNLASLQLDLKDAGYSFVTFRGDWANERAKFVTPLNGGCLLSNETYIGSSSHFANPFVMLEKPGRVYAFNLVYSGNHKETAETSRRGVTRVLTGINDFMLEKRLAPGESFSSPEAVMTFAPDEDRVSLAMHAFVGKHIVRGKWKNKERPVVINNWEATYFGFNRDKILSIAEKAAEAGVELFVLDDGWFGHRDRDDSSLGDWTDYEKKTGGLAALADGVREKGLKFGIWLEPEMISEDSELYGKHPEFAMKIPGRDPLPLRNQLMLNLADSKVQKYLIRAVSAVIAETRAAYVKWDYNRRMADCFGRDVPAGEYFLRYIEGLYTVVGKLTEKFPGVLFEGCAGGGGRFDLGMLCFMPQIWTSDNTDARCRLAIQTGTSYGYPPSVMTAHVSASPNHQTGNLSALETRFNVAAFASFGYETDLSKLSEEELATVKKQISFYKKYRKLLQYGDCYRLGDAFAPETGAEPACGFIAVAPNRTLALALVAVRGRTIGGGVPVVSFKGLDGGAVYEVSERRQDNYAQTARFTLSGELLMNGGIPLPSIFADGSAETCGNGLFTRLFVLKKAGKRDKSSSDGGKGVKGAAGGK